MVLKFLNEVYILAGCLDGVYLAKFDELVTLERVQCRRIE